MARHDRIGARDWTGKGGVCEDQGVARLVKQDRASEHRPVRFANPLAGMGKRYGYWLKAALMLICVEK